MNEDDTNKSERSYYLTPLQEKITEKRRGAFAECVDRTTHRKGTFFFQLGACINQAQSNSRMIPNQKTWLQLKQTKACSKGFVETQIPLLGDLRGLYSCRFQPESQKIVLGFGSGLIQTCNIDTGEMEDVLKPIDNEFPINTLRFHPKDSNICYAGSTSGIIWQCDLEKNKLINYAEERQNEVNSLDIDNNGHFLVSVGKDAIVRIYDVNTKHIVIMYSNPDPDDTKEDQDRKFHSLRLFAARFNPEHPDILVTGGWDKIMLVWDMRVKTCPVQRMFGVRISGEAIDLRDKTVVTGSWLVSGSLQTWDLRNGKLIDTIIPKNRPHPVDGEFLYTVQFFDGDPNNNQVLCGGSGIGAFEMINIKNKMVVARFRVHKSIIALDSFGNSICFGGMEPCFRIGEIVL